MEKHCRIGWVPALVVLVNLILILAVWHSLPETMPAHYDTDGNAAGSFPRYALWFYPLAGIILWLGTYGVAAVIQRLFHAKSSPVGLLAFSSALTLAVLCSTCVAITAGRYPIFMYMEPVFVVAGLVVLVVTGRKNGK